MVAEMSSEAGRSGTVERVHLLVKDPESVFAHWEITADRLADLRGEIGERVVAVAALTLKVFDSEGIQVRTVVLPRPARSSHVQVEPGVSSVRAELGLTLPSGQFRRLAASEAVSLPLPVPSPEPARRTISYAAARRLKPGEALAVGPRPRQEAPVGGRARGVGASDRLGPKRRSRPAE
jgi:hypothetical protein